MSSGYGAGSGKIQVLGNVSHNKFWAKFMANLRPNQSRRPVCTSVRTTKITNSSPLTRSNHIPCSRAELLARICASQRLSATDQAHFKEFGELLSALINFQSHQHFESMKNDLRQVDGHEHDGNTVLDEENHHALVQRLIANLSEVLARANYQQINAGEISDALNKTSLIPVRTAVEFNDFEEVRFYYLNKAPATLKIKKFLREKEITVDTYDRMVVMLSTASHLEEDKSRNATSQVDRLLPNSVYLNLYKNIPQGDLELLFPNIQISMTMKDKLMLVIPALGAAVPMALKILPSLGLLVGLIALTVFGFELGGSFKVDAENQKATYALFTAILSIGLALGGFAAQQYVKYKSKRLSFLKKVADTLFFKTLDVGKGVISSVVDAAEEEQCKEILLTYFLLFSAREPISETDLDRAAEAWLANEFEGQVDFKVAKALEEITAITSAAEQGTLITRLDDNTFKVCDLISAKQQLDQIWDDAFPYSGRR